MGTQIELRMDGPRATVTFRTAEGLNVISSAFLDHLEAVVAELKRSAGVRSCVFRGEGKVWIAGADISELSALGRPEARKLSLRGNAILDALESLSCVTVAVLHGAALGGGFELAAACDFRVAVATAKIGLPETGLGLIPGWGGIRRVVRLGGEQVARRLVFSGDMIPAGEARPLGLIDEVVESVEQLDAAVDSLLASLSRGGPHAIGRAKRALLTGDEIDAFVECFSIDESREGMKAFFEKRPASWMEK